MKKTARAAYLMRGNLKCKQTLPINFKWNTFEAGLGEIKVVSPSKIAPHVCLFWREWFIILILFFRLSHASSSCGFFKEVAVFFLGFCKRQNSCERRCGVQSNKMKGNVLNCVETITTKIKHWGSWQKINVEDHIMSMFKL